MISANIPNSIRKAIYRRDGYACALCGDPRRLQIHHVLPRGRMGGNTPMNLITLCSICHAAAHGTKLIEGFPYDAEDVEQACVEYVSDMYAGEWRPTMEYTYTVREDYEEAMNIIRNGKLYLQRGY